MVGELRPLRVISASLSGEIGGRVLSTEAALPPLAGCRPDSPVHCQLEMGYTVLGDPASGNHWLKQ